MPHEPIDLSSDWEHSKKLVEYEINRCAANIHDLRVDVHAQLLRMEERRQEDNLRIEAIRAADNVRHEAGAHSNSIRVAVLEAKIFLYALIGGAIGTAIINLVILKIK